VSLLHRITQTFGIHTVDLELSFPDELSASGGEARGSLSITAKSEQVVQAVKVSLIESISYTGSGSGRGQQVELGSVSIVAEPIKLDAGEARELEFVLPYTIRKVGDQQQTESEGGLQDRTGAEHGFWSEIHVIAFVDLRGVALDPLKAKIVRLV